MADEPKSEPDRDAIEQFLRAVTPATDGPIVLTAIPGEKYDTDTQTFFDASAAAGWAAARNAAGANLYWTVNVVRGAVYKKPSKPDIEHARYLHVDVDPRKPPRDGMGADELARWTNDERARIAEALESFEHPPSIVVDSGGGWQALWRLDELRHVGGSAERWAEVEARSRQLGVLLGGDNTHNIDRVLRVAGTVNWPDAKKRAKGRSARLAVAVELGAVAYPLEHFAPAPEDGQGVRRGSTATVELSGDIQPADLDVLPAALAPYVRMLIVQGDDPDEPGKYGSKSEVMWRVVNELVRAGCGDQQIAEVLLDPDLGISDHPLRQKHSVDYVTRQIGRAREENDHPLLRQMNEDHAVIEMYGGKCRVVSWQASEVDPARLELIHQSFEDFRNRYMNVRVEVGKTKEGNAVYSPAGKWWLENRMRRQYRSVVFRPDGGSDDAQDLNIWRGLAVAPRPGSWPLFRRLIVEVLAGGDHAAADYIIRWSAHAVQHPEVPAEVALAFLGKKGIGKSTYGHVMRRIFGQHGICVAGAKSITNNFNKHLHDCCLLFADEAVAPGDRNAVGLMQSYITEPMIMVEPKGLDAFPARNHLKVVIASNDAFVVEASADERRYAVFNVSPHLAAPPGAGLDDERVAFWRALNAEIDGGGIEAFLHDLLALDLGDWHPRYDVPQSGGLIAQKAASLRGFEAVWYDHLRTGTPPSLSEPRALGDDTFLLHSTSVRDYCHGIAKQRTVELNEIQAVLGEGRRDRDGVIRVPGMGFEKRRHAGTRGWVVPSLAEARRRWDEARWPGEWDDCESWELFPAEDEEHGGRRDHADAPY